MASDAPSRTDVVQALEAALRPLDYVDAFYEGGAAAWRRIDPWSDVDLYVIVEDGRTEEAFATIEASLERLAPIEGTYVVEGLHSEGLAQKFYHLRGTSPFLLIDMAVLTRSAPEKYLEPEVHGENVVLFDKTGVTEVPPLDRDAFEAKRRARLAQLRERTGMFHVNVEKDLNRGHGVEALFGYWMYVLLPLLEVLRMEHGPLHHAFGTRYVYDELPPEVVQRVEELAFARDAEDLREKYREALQWFREVASRAG